MVKRKSRPTEPEILVAAIESIERTYYIAELRGEHRRVDDEATLDIIGRIERLNPSRDQFLGQRIDISLLCARSFSRETPSEVTSKPFLMSVELRKKGCSLMAYLPADAFWALPEMISSGAITHIEAHFDKPNRGSGDLQSLYFATASKIESLRRG